MGKTSFAIGVFLMYIGAWFSGLMIGGYARTLPFDSALFRWYTELMVTLGLFGQLCLFLLLGLIIFILADNNSLKFVVIYGGYYFATNENKTRIITIQKRKEEHSTGPSKMYRMWKVLY